MELAPRKGKQSQQKVGPQFLRTAKVLLLKRRTREAINLLRRGLNLDPQCDEAALLLSKTLLRAKRLDEAKGALEKLLARVDDLSAYILLTRLYLTQGEAEAAAETAERGLTHFPLDRRLAGLLIKADKILNDTTREEPPSAADLQATAGGADAGASGDAQKSASRQQSAEELLEEEQPTPEVTKQGQRSSGNTATVQAPLPLSEALAQQELLTGPADDSEEAPTPRRPSAKGADMAEAVRRYAEALDQQAAAPPPPAPDIITAVQQLVDPEHEEPNTPRRPLFEGLLRDGLTCRETPAHADPHELGGPTPPASPSAKLRLSQRQQSSVKQVALPPPPPPPTPPPPPRAQAPAAAQPSAAGVPASAALAVDSHRRDDSRVAVPLEAQQEDVADSGRSPTPASVPLILLQPKAKPQRRRWPFVLAGILIILSAASVAGLLFRQHTLGETALLRAQELAQRSSLEELRQSLLHLRDAANLSGRSAQVVALAAAVHSRLALELGESDLQGAENLVQEATRLGAERDPAAAEELAVARATLRLARAPLPKAIGYLAKSIERYPTNLRLALLYAQALSRNGERYLAERVLARLPRSSPEVARLRAQLAWRSGKAEQARQKLRAAAELGLPHHLVLLDLAPINIDQGEASATTRGQLQSLANDPDLPSRQRGWAHLLAAVIARQQGRHEQAESSFKSAVALRPAGDPEFSLRAAQLLFDLHRTDQALDELQPALELSPRDPRVTQLAARIELSMNRVEEALARLSTDDERSEESQLLLAEAYLRRGDLSQAHHALLQMEDLRSPRRRYLLARIHLARQQPRQAAQSLQGLESRGVELEQLYLLRGLISLEQQRREQARDQLQAALRHDPWHPEALVQLGLLALQDNQGSEALRALSQAVETNPYLLEARLGLGELLLRTGQPQAAGQQFEAALAISPSSIRALTGRARAAAETATDDAEPFVQALRSRGHRLVANLLQARQQMSQGHWSEAINLLGALAQRTTTYQPQAQTWLAQAYLGAGDRLRAERSYRAAAAQTPAQPEAYLGLSELLLAAGQSSAACAQAQKAVDALGQTIAPAALIVRARVQLGRCLRRRGELQQAAAILQKALELDREGATANLELGRTYIALAQPQQATAHLATAIKSSAQGKAALRELQQLCQQTKQPLDGCPP